MHLEPEVSESEREEAGRREGGRERGREGARGKNSTVSTDAFPQRERERIQERE
jgi:hypothetical protein